MKQKKLIKIIFLMLIILASAKTVFAGFSYGNYFGGKITNTKATEIESKENSGYTCDLSGGKSITINPVRGPSTYYVSPQNKSQIISSGKWILGKYSGIATITCKKKCGDTECSSTVSLNKITLFSTSK